MPRQRPELSKSEWLVMNICWAQGKRTAREIYEKAVQKKEWEYQTVKTMLDRLAGKGYLKMEKLGPLCLFRPAVPRSRVVARTVNAFIDSVLDDSVAPLFANLAKGRKLSEEELASLKELLAQYEENDSDERS